MFYLIRKELMVPPQEGQGRLRIIKLKAYPLPLDMSDFLNQRPTALFDGLLKCLPIDNAILINELCQIGCGLGRQPGKHLIG